MGLPRAILFDVMGTLIHEPFYSDVPRFFGMTLDELRLHKDPTSWIEFEQGLIDEAAYLERFFSDRRPVDGTALKRAMRASYAWLEGMETILAELRASGRPVYALSNYSVWYEMIEEKLGLSRHLEWRFVSCVTGHRKPDREAYLVATRQLDLPPSDCLFIDDRRVNCAAATELGMVALHFKGAVPLRAELTQLGLLVR